MLSEAVIVLLALTYFFKDWRLHMVSQQGLYLTGGGQATTKIGSGE